MRLRLNLAVLLVANTLLLQPFACAKQDGSEKGRLNLDQAREYMVDLINKHRLKEHLQPVALDPVASAAAQRHAEEQAALGYSSHIDTNGQIADIRYSDVGGKDVIMENNLGSVENDRFTAKLDPVQTFDKRDLDQTDHTFFDEKPPNDGHRVNILRPEHNAVGIGLASCLQTSRQYGNSWRAIACDEEFVDHYADISDHLPKTTTLGGSGMISGKPLGNSTVYGFVFRRDDPPRRRSVQELRAIPPGQGYFLPQEIVGSLWPSKDFQVNADGSFQANIVFPRQWQPGLYYVELWCKPPEGKPMVAFRKAVLVSKN